MAGKEFFELRKKIIEKDFSYMNEKQRQAIFHVKGPVLILAGAGSGKTTVIVNRIANIVKYGNAYHSNEVRFEPTDRDIRYMKAYLEGDEYLFFPGDSWDPCQNSAEYRRRPSRSHSWTRADLLHTRHQPKWHGRRYI